MNKQTMMVVAVVGVLLAVGIFALGYKRPSENSPIPVVNNNTESIPFPTAQVDAVLYFTTSGCRSIPLVSALDEMNVERVTGERFPATDGYDYAAIEGTREMRTILSRFTGQCEDSAAVQMDTVQVLEVGITQPEEGNAE